jgi:hypothetical protein
MKPFPFSPVSFNTVEINSSFYGPPRRNAAETWAERVASNPQFRFTAKLWKGYTRAKRHRRRRKSYSRTDHRHDSKDKGQIPVWVPCKPFWETVTGVMKSRRPSHSGKSRRWARSGARASDARRGSNYSPTQATLRRCSSTYSSRLRTIVSRRRSPSKPLKPISPSKPHPPLPCLTTTVL